MFIIHPMRFITVPSKVVFCTANLVFHIPEKCCQFNLKTHDSKQCKKVSSTRVKIGMFDKTLPEAQRTQKLTP